MSELSETLRKTNYHLVRDTDDTYVFDFDGATLASTSPASTIWDEAHCIAFANTRSKIATAVPGAATHHRLGLRLAYIDLGMECFDDATVIWCPERGEWCFTIKIPCKDFDRVFTLDRPELSRPESPTDPED